MRKWRAQSLDAIYLSSSRQMLEPILEETSEDEEHAQNSWNQYEQGREHFWSSTESETGSVIRIEVNKDPDSISERDFACPAKRARRCDDFIIGGQLSTVVQSATQQPPQQQPPTSGSFDDTVLLRRTQRPCDYNEANSNSLERFLAYEACTRDSWGQQSQPVLQQQQQRNSTGSRRFDEFSDSDSISYHSLSRSSSLIQFESLERQLQLQEQHASMSSLGNSSPSLLSFDGARSTGALNGSEDGVRSGANSGSNSGNNSRRGSQISLLKRFESSDGRLHQTYFDLDKLNFDDDQRVLFGGASKSNLMEATVGEVKSDSESSTSSGSSSGNSILTASKPSAEDLTDSSSTACTRAGRMMAFQRAGKSSAENLSEDSGYCEPSTLRRTKSKSIPKNFDKFCEEEEEFQQYDYASERHAFEDVDSVTETTHQQQQLQQQHSKNNIINNNLGGDVACTKHYVVVGHEICQPKINDATFIVAAAADDEDYETSFNARTTPPPLQTSQRPAASKCDEGEHAAADDHEGDVYDVEEEFDGEEHDVHTEAIGTRHVLACPRYERVKNSPTREATTTAMLLEQRRSLAHSPSPVASDVSSSSASSSGSSCGTTRSSTSASTCASAASFTWLPTPRQLQQQQHQLQLQLQLERTQQRQSSTTSNSELLAAQHQHRSTLENFCASLRNSLPDIRDALGTTTCKTVIETDFPVFSEERTDNSDANGNGLEHLRSETKTLESEIRCTDERSTGGTTSRPCNLDDSDLSTTSASPRESHSDETGEESTPEARKRQRVYNSGSGGGGGGRAVAESSCIGGYVTGGRRISSVPSELNKLGRKKRVNTRHRHCKSSPEEDIATETSPSSSSVEEAEDEDFFDTATSLKIRRSCSWSERRERNLQRFEAAFGSRPQREGGRHWATQSLGYMNASYQDLTQLDYSRKQLEGDLQQRISAQSNLKRCSDYLASDGERDVDINSNSDNMDTPKSTASADYENIICKGNFLLDELSQIYDRNASILNDKPIDGEEQLLLLPNAAVNVADRPSCSPRPPPRQRKHSNSSYSDLDSVGGSAGCADEQVDSAAQHVQLTIRKPPARQKHARKSEATHSLVSDVQLFSIETPTTHTTTESYGKTFDQDPTNLRTSYAQSLEKCNFDPKELSNTELNKTNAIPKRRFHSQASATKQRNMVSSTPNLNAYDPHADEMEDDMYVSSAHTSMHQLPQTTAQKPLGILLSAGSRTSFSKEVSFCPVVSQYSWQEQSSEEYAEQQQQLQQERENAQQEETDDELLDNADATVIQNTRVNEIIAARYAAELKSALAAGNATKSVAQIRAVPIEKVRAMIIVRERQVAAEEQDRERARMQEQGALEESVLLEQVESVAVAKTSHKASGDYSAETKGEALKLDSNAPGEVAGAATDYNETVNAGTVNVNVSHKSTIIDATTNIVKAEQTTVAQKSSGANNEAIKNDAASQSNRNSSFSEGASGGGASAKDNASVSICSGNEQTRPLSIHLPILSEPPVNRAHHILYASQQLLDNFERRQSEQYYYQNNVNKSESEVGGSVTDRRTKSVGNLSVAQTTRYKMSNATVGAGVGGQSGSAATAAANNNNELLNRKFKDEKHPSSKGFLSRFAHGLRFSLRRKNKKQLQQQQQQQQQKEWQEQQSGEQNGVDKSTMRKSFGKSATLPQQQQRQAIAQQLPSSSSTTNKTKRASAQSGPDYIYIPLKGPIPPAGTQPPPPPSVMTAANGGGGGGASATLPANFSPADAKVGAKGQQTLTATPNKPNNSTTNNNNTNNNSTINSNRSGSDMSDMRAITDKNGEPLVTGKPPKPYRYGTVPATTSSTTIITKYFGSGRRQGGGGVPAHAHKDGTGTSNAANFKSRSQFYTDFLDAERSYYADEEIEKQLDAGLQANGNTAVTSTPINVHASANVLKDTNVVVTPQQQDSVRETNNSSVPVSVAAAAAAAREYSVEYETPSTAQETAQSGYSLPGVARETVMLLTTGGSPGGVAAASSDGNARVVAPTYTTMSNAYLQHTNNNNKIGLIETNLDTHETVISGKTRSLVDIVGPQQHQQQQYALVGGRGVGAIGGGVPKRLNMSAACGDDADYFEGDLDEDDVRVYGVHDVGGRGGAVVIKSTTANGSQIASVRRPHKSMEFLLDKENQKNVLTP
ncbi:PREDICTED: serine-rich adhesin for platelets-like isoform X2 [Rhagoletis zephyria]|uniref:serine-rich adhesin for platelets-like isoform X2 n=1 Tax=Rhagoletis zephyria TaxID=28612 RepID=UPI0008119F52|nr:PREDICTED: serine-rich adhesin for platelets-like isoform X2 [Rhagoletis zephyria]